MEPVYWLTGVVCVLLSLGSASAANLDCSLSTNTSCDNCLKNVSCLWCNTNSKCMEYPVRNILPPSSLCKLKDARWGVCWVNFEALIITFSVVGGVLVLSLVVCCYCCCCRKKKKNESNQDDERAVREKQERQARQEERRAQMKTRHDEIRKKYGLFKEDNPYSKFDE
ncbi:LOW QUALITY PROTEIN: pituitary tumor-transforming gene 1 protein-interacting protein [Rhinophrynus dorsalis]